MTPLYVLGWIRDLGGYFDSDLIFLLISFSSAFRWSLVYKRDSPTVCLARQVDKVDKVDTHLLIEYNLFLLSLCTYPIELTNW